MEIQMESEFPTFLKGKKLSFNTDFSIKILGDSSQLGSELKKYGINYTTIRDGVSIYHDQKNSYIFENYASAIRKNSQGKLLSSKENLIIFDQTNVYRTEKLIHNYDFFEEIIDRIQHSRICEHKDTMVEKLIFLSPNQGRLDLSCSIAGYEEMYFNADFFPLLNLIKEHEDSEKACSILKDTIISLFFKNPEKNENIFEVFKSFKNVKRNFSRDYDLYNSQFSFESLKNELEDEKKAFLQDYAKFYADFMPKIYGVPLQVGAYILIMNQALKIKNPMPIFLYCIMVGMVGLYSNRLICISEELLENSTQEFNDKIKQAKEKTSSNFQNLENLSTRTSSFSNNIIFFKWLNRLTHILFFGIGIMYLIIDFFY